MEKTLSTDNRNSIQLVVLAEIVWVLVDAHRLNTWRSNAGCSISAVVH
jgi:hypothetical protein